MCGISGVFDPKIENKEDIISKMVAKISHRGPDEDGFYVDRYAGLGMRRLSIIDLSSGKQPITSNDEKYLIFFNGEIYNYKELKLELEKDYFFKTNSDTEVILHLYEKYGNKMLTKLRGMFVFCIYNTVDKKIFIARDYFGIKPLYYLMDDNNIVAFSSEIKSFYELPNFKPEVNDSAVYNYLHFQYNPLTETFFKNVYKLPPAHYLEINLKTFETDIKRYWKYEIAPEKKMNEELLSDSTYETIYDSVEHHMIADVPVGSFLSGGVDSSIIATLMQNIRGDKKIKTFTVGFENLTEGNESKETSDYLDTDHKEITVSSHDFFTELPKIMYHFDEPVADPSAVGLYFVSKEARKHVKVVLSGEGADELFGGYNIYLAPFAYNKIKWIPKSILKIFAELPFNFFGKNYIKRAYRNIEDWYIGNASVFKSDEISDIWLGGKNKKITLQNLWKEVHDLSDSSKMQHIDINTWLVGDILAKADKMTMANSLELRVPFLDIEVADLARKLPDELKWKGGVTKYLLRDAFKNIIPESTRNRKKLGFPVPLKTWLTSDRDDVYNKIYENDYIKSKMNISYIKKLVSDHTSGKQDNSRKIYLLLALSIWYDVFIKTELSE